MSYASESPLEVNILTRACHTLTPPTPVILDLVAEGSGSPRLACLLQNSHQLLALGGCSSYDRHGAVGLVSMPGCDQRGYVRRGSFSTHCFVNERATWRGSETHHGHRARKEQSIA